MTDSLKFIVLDELHTYRGRQGADVAMLLRRLKNLCRADDAMCIGTSATMGGGDTWAEQSQTIAATASLLFGNRVDKGNVIGETLVRVTEQRDFSEPTVIEILRLRVEHIDDMRNACGGVNAGLISVVTMLQFFIGADGVGLFILLMLSS